MLLRFYVIFTIITFICNISYIYKNYQHDLRYNRRHHKITSDIS